MGEYALTVAELQELNYNFGLDTYPIFDESYRAGLNSKILGHYKYHEICNADSAIFKHYLNQKMLEIMPLYNQFYESNALSYNPLLTFSRTESGTASNVSETTANTNGTQGRTNSVSATGTTETASNAANKTTGKEISSDTPQGLLSAGDIDGNVWATNAKLVESGMTDTGTVAVEDNQDREETESGTVASESAANSTGTTTNSATASGYDRPLAELVQLHRDTFLNVDMKVIKELSDCFMLVY